MVNVFRYSFIIYFVLFAINSYGDFHAQVIKIVDGDTIKVVDRYGNKHSVRLVGIDSPERDQPYGYEAHKSLEMLLDKKKIKIISPKKGISLFTMDRYRRVLGKVMLDDKDINLLQVRRGMAWHFKKYIKDQELEDQKIYSLAEDKARAKIIGLWKSGNQIAPWVWRKKFKER
jgi:endonuclease YncB( thermonuclease family)